MCILEILVFFKKIYISTIINILEHCNIIIPSYPHKTTTDRNRHTKSI